MKEKTYVFFVSVIFSVLMIPAGTVHGRDDVHCNFTWEDNEMVNVKEGTNYINKRVRNRELERLVAMGKVVARVSADHGNYCQLNHPENTLIDIRVKKVDYRLDPAGRIPNCGDLLAMVECRGSRFFDIDPETVGESITSTSLPNIIVSEFSLTPSTPLRGRSVQVRIGVYNNGRSPAGTYMVEWYPGENYPESACSWSVSGNNAGGGRILNCTYPGYPSSYSGIRTKVVVDTREQITETNEGDNERLMRISVAP